MHTISPVTERWLFAAIMSPCAFVLFLLFWLQDVTQLSNTAGHQPVPATIVAASKVVRGKSVVLLATIDYRPDAGSASGCRVDVDLDPRDPTLVPGRVISVLPRKVACYEPVLAGSIGDPRWPLTAMLASAAAFAVSMFGAGRELRKMRGADASDASTR